MSVILNIHPYPLLIFCSYHHQNNNNSKYFNNNYSSSNHSNGLDHYTGHYHVAKSPAEEINYNGGYTAPPSSNWSPYQRYHDPFPSFWCSNPLSFPPCKTSFLHTTLVPLTTLTC
jgi:hypothetical protein